MYNSLLNRYYITNVNRTKVFADTQQKLEAILAQGIIGQNPASGAATSLRGKESHEGLQRELQGLWIRQISHMKRDESQSDNKDSFCSK